MGLHEFKVWDNKEAVHTESYVRSLLDIIDDLTAKNIELEKKDKHIYLHTKKEDHLANWYF